MRTLFGWKRNKRKRRYPAGRRVRSSGRTRLPQQRSWSLFDWLGGFGADDIVVDMGTANTVMYVRGRGVVVREPSVLAVDRYSREVLAVGKEAAQLTGRTPAGMELVWPVTAGSVTDYEAAVHLLRALIEKQLSGMWARPRVIVTLGTGLNSVERRALLETAAQLGARKIVGMEGPLAAAYGADLEKADPAGLLIADIGAGTTDLAIVNAKGIVRAQMRRAGSLAWDRALRGMLRNDFQIEVGSVTAEQMKVRFANLSDELPGEYSVTGKAVETGLPLTVEVPAAAVREVFLPFAENLAADIEGMLSSSTPELADWIRGHGVMLVGGGALLRGLDVFLTQRLGLPVYLAEDPFYAVAIGAGKALDEMDMLRDMLGEQR